MFAPDCRSFRPRSPFRQTGSQHFHPIMLNQYRELWRLPLFLLLGIQAEPPVLLLWCFEGNLQIIATGTKSNTCGLINSKPNPRVKTVFINSNVSYVLYFCLYLLSHFAQIVVSWLWTHSVHFLTVVQSKLSVFHLLTSIWFFVLNPKLSDLAILCKSEL